MQGEGRWGGREDRVEEGGGGGEGGRTELSRGGGGGGTELRRGGGEGREGRGGGVNLGRGRSWGGRGGDGSGEEQGGVCGKGGGGEWGTARWLRVRGPTLRPTCTVGQLMEKDESCRETAVRKEGPARWLRREATLDFFAGIHVWRRAGCCVR